MDSLYNDKLKNLILYILENNSYKEGGVKKLNKLLYFIDFYFYRDHERLITNAKYAKAEMGPILDNYKTFFHDLVSREVLRIEEEAGMIIYRPNTHADISSFSPEEIDHIRKVLDTYGKLSGADLESISHEQQPWVLTEKFGDMIDPDLAVLIANEDTTTRSIGDEKTKKELLDLAESV